MPLLRNGQWMSDDLSESSSLINLPEYMGMSTAQRILISGVSINPSDDIQALTDCLETLELIVINFPSYTDGRGYSHARILRTQMGYTGEIRAIGDIRPDQLLFMIRAGINTFNFETMQDERQIQQVLTRYETNYQPSYALPNAG
jgi:uncharacterized protein (DUF934 family)